MFFVIDPPLTDELRERVLALWTGVSNAGGAVGFVPPVTADDVRPLMDRTLAGVDDGIDRLLAAFDGDELVGLLFLVSNRFALKEHWRTVKRVMLSPHHQGRGHGSALMAEAAAVGRRMGLDALHLTVREGAGTEKFYERLGYREVGRLPGALRVAAGDDRDEIHMWLPLG